MTLDEQIAIIDKLPEEERDGLGCVCANLDEDVPPEIIRSLMRKGLVVKRRDRYDVASYWVHYAWCEWCSRNAEGE